MTCQGINSTSLVKLSWDKCENLKVKCQVPFFSAFVFFKPHPGIWIPIEHPHACGTLICQFLDFSIPRIRIVFQLPQASRLVFSVRGCSFVGTYFPSFPQQNLKNFKVLVLQHSGWKLLGAAIYLPKLCWPDPGSSLPFVQSWHVLPPMRPFKSTHSRNERMRLVVNHLQCGIVVSDATTLREKK